ncbi:pas pac sensor hybrid histidine kinase [Stylonychia lemnae]|uniref:histidine kinase n=1 Tax=Stylonychia lemnae TaxID=5949 RepID=A0A078A175_STYLE|nr:pas pac sensor hybrid histidine kinase [Stylonychia lemnae]|eukprot:CDW75602.1 pas pac sensor hybrid histidine kinase [Stylonychia lemnae]
MSQVPKFAKGKYFDKSTQQTLILVNSLLCAIISIRIWGCVTSIYTEYSANMKFSWYDSNEIVTNLVIAIIGTFLQLLFTIITAYVHKLRIYLRFSAEVGILLQALSFPIHLNDNNSQMFIQNSTFHFASIFIISFQTMFKKVYYRKTLYKKSLPFMVIYLSAHAHIFCRCFQSKAVEIYSDGAINILVFTLSISLCIGISSYIVQVMRLSSYIHKSQKSKRLKLDYRNVIENFPQGLIISNSDGKVHFINNHLQHFIDYDLSYSEMKRQESLDSKIFKRYCFQNAESNISLPHKKDADSDLNMMSLLDILKDESIEDSQKIFFDVIMTENVQLHQATDSTQTGDDCLTVEIQKVQVQFSNQQAQLIIIRNITSILSYEKQKNDQKYLELLLATVSHEMLTPLNSMIGLTSVLKKKFDIKTQTQLINGFVVDTTTFSNFNATNNQDNMKPNSSYKSNSLQRAMIDDPSYMIRVINNSAVLLQYLVLDFVDLMKIIKGQLHLNYQQSQLQKTCFDVIELFHAQMQMKNLTCKFLVTDQTPMELYFDTKKYQQVLLNIIQNAIKFTNQGGFDIFLDYIRSETCKEYDCGTLVTQVRDTGIGISDTIQKQLFQIFGNLKRVSEDSIIRTQGIGLGLSICKELAQFLGGSIKCESDIGAGTKMTFSIISKCKKCIDSQKMLAEKKLLDHQGESDHNQEFKNQEIQNSFVDAFQIQENNQLLDVSKLNERVAQKQRRNSFSPMKRVLNQSKFVTKMVFGNESVSDLQELAKLKQVKTGKIKFNQTNDPQNNVYNNANFKSTSMAYAYMMNNEHSKTSTDYSRFVMPHNIITEDYLTPSDMPTLGFGQSYGLDGLKIDKTNSEKIVDNSSHRPSFSQTMKIQVNGGQHVQSKFRPDGLDVQRNKNHFYDNHHNQTNPDLINHNNLHDQQALMDFRDIQSPAFNINLLGNNLKNISAQENSLIHNSTQSPRFSNCEMSERGANEIKLEFKNVDDYQFKVSDNNLMNLKKDIEYNQPITRKFRSAIFKDPNCEEAEFETQQALHKKQLTFQIQELIDNGDRNKKKSSDQVSSNHKFTFYQDSKSRQNQSNQIDTQKVQITIIDNEDNKEQNELIQEKNRKSALVQLKY